MTQNEQARAKIVADYYAEFPKGSAGPTGPTAEAFKKPSRLNAYKHGLTGQIHLFNPEEHEAFERHCQATVQALAPMGTLEQQLAQSIAEDKWRLNRARALESGIFALGQMADESDPDSPQNDSLQTGQPEIGQPEISQSLSQAKTWLADGKHIQLLSLYQQRIQRSIERNMAELRTLRAERKAARDQAIEEAILLSQLAKSKGETYDVAADFQSPQFVFSTAEFHTMLDRKQRLDEARALPKTQRDPNPAFEMPAAARKTTNMTTIFPRFHRPNENSAPLPYPSAP
jgi:hypothetical protein